MKVYLLFEWVEERETKNIFGIYSTLEKAQEIAQAEELSIYSGKKLVWLEENFPLIPVWSADNSNRSGEAFQIEEHEIDG